MYDPTIGRFLSADSMIPDPMNGQSYNRFSYVNNGPLSAVDPSGHVERVHPGNLCFDCWGPSGQFSGNSAIYETYASGAFTTVSSGGVTVSGRISAVANYLNTTLATALASAASGAGSANGAGASPDGGAMGGSGVSGGLISGSAGFGLDILEIDPVTGQATTIESFSDDTNGGQPIFISGPADAAKPDVLLTLLLRVNSDYILKNHGASSTSGKSTFYSQFSSPEGLAQLEAYAEKYGNETARGVPPGSNGFVITANYPTAVGNDQYSGPTSRFALYMTPAFSVNIAGNTYGVRFVTSMFPRATGD